MKNTVVAFELAREDVDKTMKVSHALMSAEFDYGIGIAAIEEDFVIPFPSNILSHIKKEPNVMLEDVRTVCHRLGIKLNKCITFTFEMTESVGVPALKFA